MPQKCQNQYVAFTVIYRSFLQENNCNSFLHIITHSADTGKNLPCVKCTYCSVIICYPLNFCNLTLPWFIIIPNCKHPMWTHTHTHTTIIHTQICSRSRCAVQCSAAVQSTADSCLSAASSSQCSKVTQCYRRLLGEPPPADSQLPACAASLLGFTSLDSSLRFKSSFRGRKKSLVSIMIAFLCWKVIYYILIFFFGLRQLCIIRFQWGMTHGNDVINLIVLIVCEQQSLVVFFLSLHCCLQSRIIIASQCIDPRL